MPRQVDFFYGLGSRYSYLASTQIATLIADTGCELRWRPLYSADLFAARGANPFRGAPLSACLRLAAEVGLDERAFGIELDATQTIAAHDATIADALAKGVFGVPSFVLDGRVYWGNDRLPIVRHELLKQEDRDGTAEPGGASGLRTR